MAQHPPMDVKTTVPGDAEARKVLVRRFARLVSLVLIIICNAIVLVGLWASGINLDELAATPDVFNSKHDICLRFAWQPVEGAADPMRICSEWINLSDPSGKTHRLQREIKFREGPDGGKYYVDQGWPRIHREPLPAAQQQPREQLQAAWLPFRQAASGLRRRPWCVTSPLN